MNHYSPSALRSPSAFASLLSTVNTFSPLSSNGVCRVSSILHLLTVFMRFWKSNDLPIFVLFPIATSPSTQYTCSSISSCSSPKRSSASSSASNIESSLSNSFKPNHTLLLPPSELLTYIPLFGAFIERHLCLPYPLSAQQRFEVLQICTRKVRCGANASLRIVNIQTEDLRRVAEWTLGGTRPIELMTICHTAVTEALARHIDLTQRGVGASEVLSVDLEDFVKAIQKVDPPSVRSINSLCTFRRRTFNIPNNDRWEGRSEDDHLAAERRRKEKKKKKEEEEEVKEEEEKEEKEEEKVLLLPSTSAKQTQTDRHTQIGFSGIVGEEKLIKRLRMQIVEPFRAAIRNVSAQNSQTYSFPAAILLEGETGTGKSMIATAIAEECNANLCVTRCADIIRPTVGESEKILSEIFEHCWETAPCILVLEDIEGIAPVRKAGGKLRVDTSSRLTSVLLYEIDFLTKAKQFGFASSSLVRGGKGGQLHQKPSELIVIATTQNRRSIDQRLLVSYRLSKNVYTTRPRKSWTNSEYLDLLHLSFPYLDKTALASALPNFSWRLEKGGGGGSVIASLTKELAIKAVRRIAETKSDVFNVSVNDFYAL